MSITQHIFGGRAYYLAEDIYRLEPQSFPGCSKTSRLMISKRSIPETEYVYAAFIKSKQHWEPKSPKYNQAKPFISLEWARANVAALKLPEEKSEEDLKIEALEAPPVLEIDDGMKFRDIEGNYLNIKMRGELSKGRIFFRASDVAEKMGLSNAIKNMLSEKSWIEGEDYVRFFVRNNFGLPEVNEDRSGTVMFFTFEGIVRYLYVSHSPNAKRFQKWANGILFTHRFGSHEEKVDLSAELLSMNVRNLKAVLNCSAAAVPAVYLFSLKSRGSDIYKFGCTSDLKRRAAEHSRKYGDIALECFSYIDPKYMYDAEIAVKELCARLGKISPGETEVVEISREDMKMIRGHFKTVGSQYSGCTSDLQRELQESIQKAKDAEMALREETQRHENEMLRAELERQKESAASELAMERLQNKLELAELKLKYYESR